MRSGWLVVGALWGCSEPTVEDWQPDGVDVLGEVAESTQFADGFVQPMGLFQHTDGVWVADEAAGMLVLLDDTGQRVEQVTDVGAPRWVVASNDVLVFAEGVEQGRVVALDRRSADTMVLSQNDGMWSGLFLGENRIWWYEKGERQAHFWDVEADELGVVDVDGVVQGMTVAGDEATFIVGTGPKWSVLNELGERLGEVGHAPQDMLWWQDALWISTRSSRWPYGGWIYRFSGSGVAKVASYSPPEPGAIAATNSALVWGSKQSLTRYVPGEATYEVVGAQTAVFDLVVKDDAVIWSDRQRGVLLTWTD